MKSAGRVRMGVISAGSLDTVVNSGLRVKSVEDENLNQSIKLDSPIVQLHK